MASAASSEELDPLLEIAGVRGMFDHVVRPDEVEGSKPDPDILRAALGWKNEAPDRAVMIGDTRFDIEVARKAQVRCIALRCGGSPEAELAAADAVFDSPLELAHALQNANLDDVLAAAHRAKPAAVRG